MKKLFLLVLLAGCSDFTVDGNMPPVQNPICMVFCRIEHAVTDVGAPTAQSVSVQSDFIGGSGADVN